MLGGKDLALWRLESVAALSCRASAKHKREREEALFSSKPGEQPPLELLDKILPSFPEGVIASIEEIVRFPRDGGMRSPEEQFKLGTGFLLRNRITEFLPVRLFRVRIAPVSEEGFRREIMDDRFGLLSLLTEIMAGCGHNHNFTQVLGARPCSPVALHPLFGI